MSDILDSPNQETPSLSIHERVSILEARLEDYYVLMRRSKIQDAKSKQKLADELARLPKSRLIKALLGYTKQSRRADLQIVSYTSQEAGLRDHRGNIKEAIDWLKKIRKSGKM